MPLSTIATNQVKDAGIKNEDMLASTATNPFRTNHNEIDTDLTIASTENAGGFGPITVSATITINGVLTIV